MAESDVARVLLAKAQDDLHALGNMLDHRSFSTAIFGFHAQQAVEKAAKAWLIVLGWDPPFTHDLRELLFELEQRAGSETSQWRDFLALNPFAARLRYGEEPRAHELDRLGVLGRVSQFVAAAAAAVAAV